MHERQSTTAEEAEAPLSDTKSEAERTAGAAEFMPDAQRGGPGQRKTGRGRTGQRRAGWWLLGAAMALLVAFVGLATLLQPLDGAPQQMLGVRLGMGPDQVRRAISPWGRGRLRTSQGVPAGEAVDGPAGEQADLVLDWSPRGQDAAPLRHARLEFHAGLLVAVRLDLASGFTPGRNRPVQATGFRDSLSTTDDEVVLRVRSGNRTRVTWLSRKCPTHRAEVQRILGRRD